MIAGNKIRGGNGGADTDVKEDDGVDFLDLDVVDCCVK